MHSENDFGVPLTQLLHKFAIILQCNLRDSHISHTGPIFDVGVTRNAGMACLSRKLLKTRGDVCLVEEQIYLGLPELVIETTYAVTSSREPSGLNFSSLAAAETYFQKQFWRA